MWCQYFFQIGIKLFHLNSEERIIMTNFDNFLAAQMQDEEFRKEYEALEPEFTIMQAMIDDQHSEELTSDCSIKT